MGITFSLAFSDTSLVLLTTIIVISLYTKYFSGYTPLVHPLLLQKQSDVSQTRKEGESAVYRNWATGHETPVSLKQTAPSRCWADGELIKEDSKCLVVDESLWERQDRSGCREVKYSLWCLAVRKEGEQHVLQYLTDLLTGTSSLGFVPPYQVTNSDLLEQANDILYNLSLLAPHLISPPTSTSSTSTTAAPTYILSLLPPSLPLLQLHLARSLTTRLRLIALSVPFFLVSALESEDHPKPKVIFTGEEYVAGVLEQLVEKDDANNHNQGNADCRALVVVVPNSGEDYKDRSDLVKRAGKMGVKVVNFEQLQRGCFKPDVWERPGKPSSLPVWLTRFALSDEVFSWIRHCNMWNSSERSPFSGLFA
jgi:hypothetical protein